MTGIPNRMKIYSEEGNMVEYVYGEKLYRELLSRGYDEKFCRLISQELRTDFTAKRMLGYLRQFPSLPPEEIVDEMLAIEADRDAWIKKKQSEQAQQSINEFMLDN